jgi:hypothetical protein
MKGILVILACLGIMTTSFGQDVVPKAKTKAQQKAERKNKSLKQKIEDTLPVQVDLPTPPSINLPGDNKISSVEDAKKFLNETLPDVKNDLKKKAKKAKKFLNKDGFDGKKYETYKVQKKILKKGSGSRLIYQEFYVLKGVEKANMYQRNLFWLNLKTKKIVEAIARDNATNVLLHGPYKEYHGENLFLEGSYFLGSKHGRWLYYDKDFNLVNKEYYNKGFFSDAKISYYGADSLKIKEVFPVVYGDTTGAYWKFYEDATLAEEGKYDHGKKVGKWVEYHQGGNRRKKETQHPSDLYDTTAPYIVREYDGNGKLIFENANSK